MGINKFIEDHKKGKLRREHEVVLLNAELSDSYKIERIHLLLKSMHISEKVKNNITPNRIRSSPFMNAMGLDYHLIKKSSDVVIPLRFLNIDVTNLYLKLPNDYINNWQEYLLLLSNFKYHFIR